jgi:outer membrane lipoprotein-sorting protein
MFDRIEFKFVDKQNRTEMVEKIIKRNSQPIITDKTFTFSPPKGVKKVKSLLTEPFKL